MEDVQNFTLHWFGLLTDPGDSINWSWHPYISEMDRLQKVFRLRGSRV